jgi:hypothetical protein
MAWCRTLAWHGLGLVLGALISAGLIYLLGLLWRPSLLVAGSLAAALGILRFLYPDRVAAGGFKVPRDWAAWGIGRFLGAFGLMLGMGFITTMPSPAMLALLVLLWHVHSLWFTIVAFEAFAITRGLTTSETLYLQARNSGDVVVAADTLVDKLRHVPRAEAAVSIALGITLLASAL